MPSEKGTRFWPKSKYSIVIILVLIFALSLFLRIYPRLGVVFGSGWVKFGETDPWYHIRLLENLLHHFPHSLVFDAYSYFPYGRAVPFAPMFDLILGSVLWVLGLGSPSQHLLEVVAAYFPAILGALTVIPVFFIGKALFNYKVGLIGAALIAVLPGDFFARSLLGLTDHHIAETLFSTVTALFLILAINNGREKELDFRHLWQRDWKIVKKPLIYALLCGFFLGLYMTSWAGGPIFVLIIFVYFIIQFIIDHLTGKSTDYLCLIGVPSFLIAMVMVIPFMSQGSLEILHPVSLALGAAVFTALAAISWLMRNRSIKRAYYPLVLVVLGIVAIVVFYIGAHSAFTRMVGYFQIFTPQGGAMTVTEVQPMFFRFHLSALTQSRVWGFFNTGFFYFPIALILIVYSAVKKVNAGKIFLLTWSVLMLVAMIGQNRFSYYFAVNVALFGGYLFWRILEWVPQILGRIGFRDRKPQKVEFTPKKKSRKKGQIVRPKEQKGFFAGYLQPRHLSFGLAIIIGFFFMFYPNISFLMDIPKNVPAPDSDWHESLVWMKNNTPDPFNNPDSYYQLYRRPAPGESYKYPPSAYGVMSWWDYGHWITEIAHRIPNANAFQDGAANAARFFTAQNEASASEILNGLGSRYVIVELSIATSKQNAMDVWAGVAPSSEYFYQRSSTGQMENVLLYYPEFYKTMSSRLYIFGGKAVVPNNTSWVITYAERVDANGTKYKEISSSKLFPTYQEAETYRQKTPGSIIVGNDPFVSPIPLEALTHYQMVHSSSTVVWPQKSQASTSQETRQVSSVEIFEYKP